MALMQGNVGPQVLGEGAQSVVARMARSGEQVITNLHGRYAEQALRGNIYTAGMSLTSISNATFTIATTDATATPIIGLWNPANSGVNAVILRAYLGVSTTALQATGPGGYTWMVATGNSAITTGINPFRTSTLQQSGSACKAYANTALTGKTGTLAAMRGSSLCGGSAGAYAFLATAVAMQTQHVAQYEDIEGSIIVPPGGVLSLQCNTTPVAHSATSGLLWEEVPV